MVKVLYVCLGNICRSPLGEASFNKIVKERGLGQSLWADSAGTAGYHIGKKADPRSIKTAENHGIELTHVVQKVSKEDLDNFDHIAVMDESNFEDIHKLYYDYKGVPPSVDKLFLIRDFDPEVRGVNEVPDPYYENASAFEEVYQMLDRSNQAFVDHLVDKYGLTAKSEEEAI